MTGFKLGFLAVVIWVVAVLPGHAMAPDAEAWQRAYVALPAMTPANRPVLGRFSDTAVQKWFAAQSETPDVKIPAVIYMHGCAGMGREGQAYRYMLAANGIAMIAPDSFAPIDRRANCDSARHSTNQFPEAEARRDAELRYAVAALRQLPGMDQDKIYLAGFSEGAVAVARYAGNDVAGLLITAWHCHGREKNTGIQAGKLVPVLAILGEADPWYRAKAGLDCGPYVVGRPGSENITLPDNGHRILTSPNIDHASLVKEAILEFLQRP